MCYSGFNVAPQAPQQQTDTFADDIDAFAWLDELGDDELGMGLAGGVPVSDESTESSIKVEATGVSAMQQDVSIPQVVSIQAQAPAFWPMPAAMPGFTPVYATAPWMGMLPPPMVAAPPAPVAPPAPLQAPPAPLPAPPAPQVSAAPPAPVATPAPAAPAPAAPTATTSVATSAAAANNSKQRKSQQEMDEAIERIKQKRRESAQRSRNRRAAYMKQLESENKALREEVTRLRAALTNLQPGKLVAATPVNAAAAAAAVQVAMAQAAALVASS